MGTVGIKEAVCRVTGLGTLDGGRLPPFPLIMSVVVMDSKTQ